MLAPINGHTLPTHQIGATYYIAPEQSRGYINEKNDLYALGAIAYELCTGHRLKEAGSSASPGQQRLRSPRQLNPSLPIQIDRAILRAVAVNPDLRYDTVEAFLETFSLS